MLYQYKQYVGGSWGGDHIYIYMYNMYTVIIPILRHTHIGPAHSSVSQHSSLNLHVGRTPKSLIKALVLSGRTRMSVNQCSQMLANPGGRGGLYILYNY